MVSLCISLHQPGASRLSSALQGGQCIIKTGDPVSEDPVGSLQAICKQVQSGPQHKVPLGKVKSSVGIGKALIVQVRLCPHHQGADAAQLSRSGSEIRSPAFTTLCV